MVHLQKIAQFFNQIDIGELSQLEKQIGKLLEQEGYLVKEEIPFGTGEDESYWVYSIPKKVSEVNNERS
jgi:hypothetical protein